MRTRRWPATSWSSSSARERVSDNQCRYGGVRAGRDVYHPDLQNPGPNAGPIVTTNQTIPMPIAIAAPTTIPRTTPHPKLFQLHHGRTPGEPGRSWPGPRRAAPSVHAVRADSVAMLNPRPASTASVAAVAAISASSLSRPRLAVTHSNQFRYRLSRDFPSG